MEATSAIDALSRVGQSGQGKYEGLDPDDCPNLPAFERRVFVLHSAWRQPISAPVDVAWTASADQLVAAGYTRESWESIVVSNGGTWPPPTDWWPGYGPGGTYVDGREGPITGGMERVTWEALVGHLRGDEVTLFWALGASFAKLQPDHTDLWCEAASAPAGALFELFEDPEFEAPNNMWPSDLSWFTYSDHDGHATLICCTHELAERLLADPHLEILPADR